MPRTRGSHQWRVAYNSGRTRMRRLERDPEVLALVRRLAAQRRVAVTDILRITRGNPAVADARQLGMYLAHVQLGRNQDVVAKLFGRDRTTVAYACHQMEDKRDAALDAEIARIVTDADPRWSLRSRRLGRRRLRHGA